MVESRRDSPERGADLPAQVAAIRSAQKTFTYAQYVYETGPPAQALIRAMSERCQSGVHGHILVDGIGSLSMPAESRQTLEQAGCEFAIFRPVDLPTIFDVNDRNHRRILVVDGRIGFTGGSGASSKWMGNGRREGYWRQTDVRIEGHAVTDLQAAFAENWLEATGRALGERVISRVRSDEARCWPRSFAARRSGAVFPCT